MIAFARHVVREQLPLALFSSSARLQKRQGELIKSILGGRVYCYFERHKRRLACAFSNEPKALLGETVRDWLLAERGSRNFLWCEVLDGRTAVALVANGQVVKDDLAGDLAAAAQEARRRFGNAGRLFAHRSAADRVAALALGEPWPTEVLDVSVADRAGEARELPALRPIDDIPAVRKWNAFWRATKLVVFVAALGFGAVAAWTWWKSRNPDAAVAGPIGPGVQELEYENLMRTPDVGALLPAIHGAYRQFLADPVFGAHWTIQSLKWARPAAPEASTSNAGDLEIVAALPEDVLTAPADKDGRRGRADEATRFELPEDAEAEVLAYARRRGWRLELAGASATMRIPVSAAPRSAPNEARLQEDAPGAETWRQQALIDDFAPLGELQMTNLIPKRPFRAYAMTLRLRDAEWATGDVARWLGDRLGGGPVALQSFDVSHEGASVSGSLTFWLVWCIPTSTNSCATG